jgi:outer membrane lipoprotein-sorting protein
MKRPSFASRLLALPILFLLAWQAPAEEAAAPAPQGPAVPGVEEILQRCEAAIKPINDYTGYMDKQERFIGEMGGLEKTFFKFSRPFKVYIKFLNVHNGREAIFVKGRNSNEVKVHKGTFPDINVNLDPQGGTAMEGNHHPITDFGLENTIRISAANLRKALKRGEGDFQVSDGGVVNGRPVWKIDAKLPKGGHYVTAKDDETLWDIARRTGQDMYLIMYSNKDYDDPDDPDEGDKVFIPRYYGGRSELLVDKETYLPVKATTWDWNGRLYETYSYHGMKVNVGLTDKDFDPNNKEYNF